MSLHAVLVLPAPAWLLSRTPRSGRTRQHVMYTVGYYTASVLAAGMWAGAHMVILIC
ncbi:hypothetical protein [Streptomyces sp. SD15]